MALSMILQEIEGLADPVRAKTNAGFFKDHHVVEEVFIGVRVPDVRKIVRKYLDDVGYDDFFKLLDEKVHEYKVAGVIGAVEKYKKEKDPKVREKYLKMYLKNANKLNNWDLVDASAPYIVGSWILDDGDERILETLVYSKNMWERRVGIVTNWMLIRHNRAQATFELAALLLDDPEDLMHKATGWMLREAGKKDIKALNTFLDHYAHVMPRTMLRYALEKFPEVQRKKYLKR
jgi:3-methyladenine DNA glycosylase AlkD